MSEYIYIHVYDHVYSHVYSHVYDHVYGHVYGYVYGYVYEHVYESLFRFRLNRLTFLLRYDISRSSSRRCVDPDTVIKPGNASGKCCRHFTNQIY